MNATILAGVAALALAGGTDPPRAVAADDDPRWPYQYWDIYGLISDGSMWNPEAFAALDWRGAAERRIARARAEATTVEVVEPREREREEQRPTAEVFIAPTLLAACGMYRPQLLFEFASADIADDEVGTLDALARCLAEPPLDDKLLSIEGHTDPRGTESFNRELGLLRADAIAQALIERGIAADRIDTYSRGETLASSNPTRWDENRRVVIDLDE